MQAVIAHTHVKCLPLGQPPPPPPRHPSFILNVEQKGTRVGAPLHPSPYLHLAGSAPEERLLTLAQPCHCLLLSTCAYSCRPDNGEIPGREKSLVLTDPSLPSLPPLLNIAGRHLPLSVSPPAALLWCRGRKYSWIIQNPAWIFKV